MRYRPERTARSDCDQPAEDEILSDTRRSFAVMH